MAESKNSNTQSFRLLDLPAELRVLIYEKIIEQNPVITLARTQRDRELGNASSACIMRPCKLVHKESVNTLHLCATTIVASVRNYNFSHIVTFLNRLDERVLEALEQQANDGKTGPTVTKKTREIPLFLTSGEDDRQTYLDRWLNRLDHPSKKGAHIECKYSRHPDTEIARPRQVQSAFVFHRRFALNATPWPAHSARSPRIRAEPAKIAAALAQ